MANLSAVRRRERQAAQRWCILRTSARSTITLVDKLEEDGYDVWTPIEVGSRRMPRSKKRVEMLTPVMPSFVFADFDVAGDLFRLSADRLKDHPDFSVFHYRDRVPFIADRDLAQLRAYEEDAAGRRARQQRRFRRADPLSAGEALRMPGAFEGMQATVDESNGKFTFVVCGSWRIKMETIDASHLRTNTLQVG